MSSNEQPTKDGTMLAAGEEQQFLTIKSIVLKNEAVRPQNWTQLWKGAVRGDEWEII
jgi:hypothetical protein